MKIETIMSGSWSDALPEEDSHYDYYLILETDDGFIIFDAESGTWTDPLSGDWAVDLSYSRWSLVQIK